MGIDDRSMDYETVKPSRFNRGLPQEEAIPLSQLTLSETDVRSAQPLVTEPSEQRSNGKRVEKKPIKVKTDVWNPRRGHMATFIALFVYAVFAYFRPFDLIPALSWTAVIPYWLAIGMLAIFVVSQLSIEGNFTARPREVNLIFLLTVTAILSIPLAPSVADAWDTFNRLFIKTVLAFIVLVNVTRTERRLKLMIFLSFAAGFYMSAIALSDYGAGNPDGGDLLRAKAEIGNMFGEPNSLALHLVTMIPIAAALFLTSRNALKKVLYAGGTLLMVAGTFATQSRGGFLGLTAGIGVLAWKFGRRNRVLMIAVLVVAAVSTMVFAPGGYGGRMATIFNPDSDSSAISRRELLKRSIFVTLANPVFGIGIGNFQIVGIRGQVTHNAYTQVSSEMGIAGLVFYVLFIVAGYKRLKTIEKETLNDRTRARFYYLAVGLQGGLVSYIVGSFFLSVAYEWYVYFLVGYAICFQRIYDLRFPQRSEAANIQTTKPINSSVVEVNA